MDEIKDLNRINEAMRDDQRELSGLLDCLAPGHDTDHCKRCRGILERLKAEYRASQNPRLSRARGEER